MMENKKSYKSKKAFIDQILLVLFIFFSLIAIGATISDNMQARDKYYNLKKVTDNAVLTLAKYYNRMDKDTTAAEDINYDMLIETKLGDEVKDMINYTWDFASDPNTITATIDNYQESTFWLRWIGLDTLTINVESIATVTNEDLPDPKTDISYGFAPFAVNDRTFNIGDTYDLDYALTADWAYANKNTFYPIFTNCDCDCDFMLSNKFDFSDLGFDMSNCNSSSTGCTTHGESEFRAYTQDIGDIYNSEPLINFKDGKIDAPICLAGTYLGTTNSTWNTQINHLSSGIQDIVGNNGADLPIDMDILVLNTGAIATDVVRLRVTGFSYKKTGGSGTRYITLNTEVIPAVERDIELEK